MKRHYFHAGDLMRADNAINRAWPSRAEPLKIQRLRYAIAREIRAAVNAQILGFSRKAVYAERMKNPAK